MQTVNKLYPLPNKNHDVLEDLAGINDAFSAIDSDVTATEALIEVLQSTVSNLEARSLTIPEILDIDTEIQSIKANNYLVTNKDGNGFTTTEGGGTEGGLLGECLAKISDENYKTKWRNFWEITRKTAELHILADEEKIVDQSIGLVSRQAKSNVFSDSNDSAIIADSIEQISDAEDVATHSNYGLVKIGDGVNIDAGIISVPRYGNASADNFGLVKIGDGIAVTDGVISVQPIENASHHAFGVVKLSDDFELNENGELKLATKTDGEPIIYGIAKRKIVSNGIIELEESIAIYRAFLNEDLQFSFNLSFDPKKDFSFILEIISDGKHLIGFDESIKGADITGVNRGTTAIKFTKLLGADFWNADVSLLEAPEPVLLAPNNGDSVKSDLIVSSNGSSWDVYGMLGADVGNIGFYNNPREIYFDFAKSVVVDYVYFNNSSNNELALFELLGSNDKINWSRLIYKANSVIDKNTLAEQKGCFHYFKLRFSSEENIRGIQLYGSIIDNNDSELILLTPQIGSNSVAGITISGSNLRANNWRDVTYPSANSYVELDNGAFSDSYLQYEFTTPRIANFLDMASHQDQLTRTARWFKLIASNDGENWDLLLERQYQEDWKQCETRYFEFENATAYKYYRLVCSYTSDGNLLWRISRFRLFRRESGTSSFINVLPPLLSASQDGYEVSANSFADSSHVAVNAFDRNADTKWATASGDHLNSWLKIKLPEATAINAAYLQTRNDGYYYQAPSVFKIQGSKDGMSWTQLTHETASWTQGEVKIFYWFNEMPYLYYQLLIESVQSGTNAGLAEFSIGTRAKSYRRHLNKYDYIVPNSINSSSFAGDDGLYTLSSSSEHSQHKRYYLFDRNFDTRFELNNEESGWIQVELPMAKFINNFSVGSRSDSWCDAAPRDYTLIGSNNGSSWDTIFSVASSPAFTGSELRTHQLSHSIAYKFYRLNISNSNRGSVLTFARWDLIHKSLITEY